MRPQISQPPVGQTALRGEAPRPVSAPAGADPIETRFLAALAGFGAQGASSFELAESLGDSSLARDAGAVLRRMVARGLVLENRPGRWAVSGTGNEYPSILIEEGGVLKAPLADGRVAPVHPRHAIGAKAGDVVQVGLGEDGQAIVTRILRRVGREVVGTIVFKPGGPVLVCDNRREGFLPVKSTFPDFDRTYRAGDRYVGVVEVDSRGEGGVTITRALPPGSPEVVDFRYVCLAHDLPGEFSPEVLAEAEAHPKKWLLGRGKSKREDLRKKLVWTIDPATAKDFDDAISLEHDDDGNWILGVHIADVSHYVREGGAVDLEATTRGTSCYLVNRVIPMLPERLSNGLCSLVPHEPRYCLSAFLTVDRQGTLLHTRLAETLIESRHRFTYEEAMDVLVNKDAKGKWPADVRSAVQEVGGIAQILRRNREKAGALNLFSVEHRFKLDVDGVPVEITQESSDASHQLIEECMLLANRAVAEWLEEQGLPCVYRLHSEPDAERLEQFGTVLAAYGKDPGALRSRFSLQRLLFDLAKEPPAARLVLNYLCLRAFKKAVYGIEKTGHYALAFASYAHFTSPIRRYPDLMVHRLVKRGLGLKDYAHTEIRPGYLDPLAKQSSFLEQRAEQAERDLHARKSARYLARRIGETVASVVVTAHPGGLSVHLLDCGMEGTIPLRELKDDFYDYDQKTMSLIGRRSRKVITCGAEVDVVIAAVDVERNDVVFSLDRGAASIRPRPVAPRQPQATPRPVPPPAPPVTGKPAAPAVSAPRPVAPAPVKAKAAAEPTEQEQELELPEAPPAGGRVGGRRPPIDPTVDRRRLPDRWRSGGGDKPAKGGQGDKAGLGAGPFKKTASGNGPASGKPDKRKGRTEPAFRGGKPFRKGKGKRGPR